MSLSPRPDRFTSKVASGPSSCATLTAPAKACALSIAGMMPSVRHSSANASIASASVTGSALAGALRVIPALAAELGREPTVLICLSGRGDKDVETTNSWLLS